jgi:hypothetical protein
MNYSHRFFLYAPVAAFVAIAAAVMIWWNIAANSLDRRLTMSNGREIMPGVRMSYASKSTSGFPFSLDTVLDHVAIGVQTRIGPLVWQSEHFAIHALTYGPQQQIFEAAGAQTLSWTDSDGVFHRVTFLPGSLRASAIVAHGRLSRFDLDAVAINTEGFTADRLQFHIRHAPDHDAMQFVVKGDNVGEKPSANSSDRRAGRQFVMSGDIAPELPFESLLAGEVDWRAAVEAWRLKGGFVTVNQFETQLNGVHTVGSGRFWLDGVRELSGRLNLSFVSQRPLSPLDLFSSTVEQHCKEAAETFHVSPDKTYRLAYKIEGGYLVCKITSPYGDAEEQSVPPPPGSFTLTSDQMQRLLSMPSTDHRPDDRVVAPLY